MTKINKIPITDLNNDFNRFSSGIVQGNKQNYSGFITQLSKYERQYKKLGYSANFAQTLFSFSGILEKNGLDDFAGIVLSNLIKMPFLKPHVKEFYIKKAIELYRRKGDSIHTVARLVDLRIMYKQAGQTYKFMKVLFEEEKELMKVCGNYQAAKRNFRSYSRAENSHERYELELAKVRVDLAKLLIKSNPQKATALLNKAKITFQRQQRQKEIDFVNGMLSEIV